MTLRTIYSDRLVDGEKIETIVTDWDGTLFLSDDGTYKEAGGGGWDVAYGAYVPVFTSWDGVMATIAVSDFFYTRVWDIVSVRGSVYFVVAAGAPTYIKIDLPIASDFPDLAWLSGTVLWGWPAGDSFTIWMVESDLLDWAWVARIEIPIATKSWPMVVDFTYKIV